jgi:type IV pilus assembly protein PilX
MMTPHANRPGRLRGHRGTVLVIGLVVLLVVTMLGVSAMQVTVLQERMAGNLRQNDMALQAAEAGLQAALAYLENRTTPPSPSAAGTELVWPACTAGLAANSSTCTNYAAVITDWQDPTSLTEGEAYGSIDAVAGASGLTVNDLGVVVAQPRVYIESRYVPPLDLEEAAAGEGTHYYTVTAVGYGQTANAVAIVQSTIAKVYQY